MYSITNKYYEVELESEFKYDDKVIKYEIAKVYDSKAVSYYDLFYNKYSLFTKLSLYKIPKTGPLRVFYEQIKGDFQVPTLYQPLSKSFLVDYSIFTNIEKYIINKRNLLLFNWGINISEALLYIFTIRNIINQITIHLHHLFCIPKSNAENDLKEITLYFNKLKQNYEGELLYLDDVNQKPYDDYEKIINKYLDKNIDLIVFDYRFVSTDTKNMSFEKLNFVYTIIALSVLQKNGVYVFRNWFSSTYLNEILLVLSSCFEKIFITYDIIQTMRHYFVVCTNYRGISKENMQVLKKVLEKWNQKLVGCGTSQNDYGSITKLFKNKNSDVEKNVNKYMKNVLKYYNKIINFYKEGIFNADNLPYETLKQYYDDHIHITYNNHIQYAKTYDIILSNNFLEKAPNYTNEINTLYIFNSPPLFAYIADFIYDPLVINPKITNIPSLEKIKQNLIMYKIGIDTRNPKRWDKVTFDLNISQGLIEHFKKKYGVNFSRAFFKMYEILETFDPFTKTNGKINTIHICEAPGHFINATNYYIKSKYPNKEWNWHANSLNPNSEIVKQKYGNVLSDVYGFIKKYNDKWLWGNDGTGDITSHENIAFFKEKYENSADLMTSDCGLGAKTRFEYHSQEEWVGKINFCQILIGLIVTKLGGTSVFKYYMPFTKPISVSMIYLLVQHYESLNIFKPLMTSSTNNEIYIVAQNKIKKLEDRDYKIMLEFLNDFNMESSLYHQIDKLFIDNTYSISEKIMSQQIESLKVIYYYYQNDYNKELITSAKKHFANKWIEYYNFNYKDISL